MDQQYLVVTAQSALEELFPEEYKIILHTDKGQIIITPFQEEEDPQEDSDGVFPSQS